MAGVAGKAAIEREPVVVRPRLPFDLVLSVEAAASFLPSTGAPPVTLRTAVEIENERAVVEVSQRPEAPDLLYAVSTPPLPRGRLQTLAKWLVSEELDLGAFNALAAAHPVMSSVVRSLPGLKPLRPATFFEMAVMTITEQQLSLAAAFHIRDRLVTRFETLLGDLRIFPSPAKLARASVDDLAACGLSRRKAEYVKDTAQRVAAEAIDFETLRCETDERIREKLLRHRGFGAWSVEYILGRGFGRTDSLPSADSGLRRVVGRYLADGRRLTAVELEQALAPFKPYRGLAAYYLAVHWRLRNSHVQKKSVQNDGADNGRRERTRHAEHR